MSDLFGQAEGNMVGVDDKGNTKITRSDLTSYEKYLDQVAAKGPGFEARLTVPTGEPVIVKKTGRRTGRGKVESRHDRGFRQVAADRGLGIRIVAEPLPDGKTMLRIALTSKREFSALANARRDRGRINYQATQAIEKANAAKVAKSPDASELAKHARALVERVKQLDAQIAELSKDTTPTNV